MRQQGAELGEGGSSLRVLAGLAGGGSNNGQGSSQGIWPVGGVQQEQDRASVR